MNTLKQLVDSLTPSEKRVLRKFYAQQPNGEDKKRLKLFELVASKRVETNEKAAKALYGKKPGSAFSHTKKRLKKDILDFLLMQDASKHYNDKGRQVELNVSKWALQGEMLLARGIYGEGEKLLRKALNIAEDYELFSDVLRIKNLLRTSVGFRRGMKAFQEYSEKMDYYVREYEKLLKVREYNFKIRLPNQFFTNKKNEYIEFSTKALSELEALHIGGSSVTFTFQYYLLRVFYCDLVKDFDSALFYAENLLKLVENELIYQDSTVNIAGINMVLSDVHLNLSNYTQAISYAEKAVEKFFPGMINELRAMEYLFFAFLRNKSYEEARELINQAIKHPQIKSNRIVKARWNFFLANLEYLNGNEDVASNLIRQNSELQRDKSGWLIGFRLLEMMITADGNEHYLLNYQLNNYNHLLSRKKNENVARAKLIGRIFRSLMRNRGDFAQTLKLQEKKIDILESGEGEYYWDPKGYEVIRFEDWFRSKAERR